MDMDHWPLENLRVADFSWAAAGPYSTLLLASLGAEVIKISSARAQGGFPRQRAADIDRYLNYNKLAITLDLTTPEGAGLARKLISVCDVVVENFRPGTIKRFGLDYQDLVRVRPDLVMISSSSLGSQGPQARYTGYAPIFGTTSGLSHITGYSDGIPTELRLTVDYTVGTAAAFAVLVALHHQRTSGQGQYIDLASRDVMTSLMGEHLLNAQLNGAGSPMAASPRMGNRDDIMAPHGVYRCQGDDAWISIAVGSHQEWQGLCAAMGRQEWLSDERYSDAYARWNHQDDLDSGIGAWTASYDKFQLTALLQSHGVPASPSYSAEDLFADPHLEERRFSQKVPPPSGDQYTVINAPWLFDGQRFPARRHAPAAGESNGEVLGDLLGIPDEQIRLLMDQGVVR